MYEDYLQTLEQHAIEPGEEGCAAEQLLALRDAALVVNPCVFLELGTDRGQSTKAILSALAGTKGTLVSVDVDDCSAAGSGDNWIFVRADSKDVDAVLQAAPVLKDGIDCLYIDSLHTAEHVKAELYGYFPYLKKGGKIFFDDVDAAPYMRGRRKDSVDMEIANRRIHDLIRDVFYDNIAFLRLDIRYGSTGLAVLTKMSEFGDTLKPYTTLVAERKHAWFWKLRYRFGRKKAYVSKADGSDMLIKPKR